LLSKGRVSGMKLLLIYLSWIIPLGEFKLAIPFVYQGFSFATIPGQYKKTTLTLPFKFGLHLDVIWKYV
jgi:hypothetical protein